MINILPFFRPDRMRVVALWGLLGLAICVIVPGVLLAQRVVLPGQGLAEQRSALEQAESEADIAKRRAERLQLRAEQAEASADKAKRRVEAVAAQIQATEARMTATKARISIIEQLRARQTSRLVERQQPIARLTAALQQQSRRPAALALVKPGSINDLVHLRAAMASITPQVEALSVDLRADIDRTQALRERAQIAADALRSQQTQLDEQRRQLALLETRRRSNARDLAGNARLQEDRAIALAEDARSINQLIGRIEDSAELREQLAALEGPVLRSGQAVGQNGAAIDQSNAPKKKPVYVMPVAGQVVTGFGEVSTSGISSRGITLKVPLNAQVTAPSGGRIGFAGVYLGFGQIVIIEHDAGWTTLLTGLARIGVSVGDEVDQGAPLGQAIGDSENMLLELRRKGKPVDVATLIAIG